jgi:hypothetical protein
LRNDSQIPDQEASGKASQYSKLFRRCSWQPSGNGSSWPPGDRPRHGQRGQVRAAADVRGDRIAPVAGRQAIFEPRACGGAIGIGSATKGGAPPGQVAGGLGRDRGRSGMSKRARLKDGPRISHGNKAVAAVPTVTKTPSPFARPFKALNVADTRVVQLTALGEVGIEGNSAGQRDCNGRIEDRPVEEQTSSIQMRSRLRILFHGCRCGEVRGQECWGVLGRDKRNGPT